MAYIHPSSLSKWNREASYGSFRRNYGFLSVDSVRYFFASDRQ